MGKLVSKTLGAVGLGGSKAKTATLDSKNFNMSKELKPSQQGMRTAFDQSQTRMNAVNPAQNAVLTQMGQAAQGQGPSLAEVQMRSAMDRNLAQQLAATQASRGGSSALNQRALLSNLSSANRDLGQQAAAARLGERDAFMQQANIANQQARADIAQRADLDTMNKRSLQQRDVSNTAAVNATRQANAAADNQLAGSLIGGAGTILGGFLSKPSTPKAASGGKITKDGVQNYAEGGKVQHFQQGGKSDVEKFKKANTFLESGTKGDEVVHPTAKHGPDKGLRAFGAQGLMPSTAIDEAKKIAKTASPEAAKVASLKPSEVYEYLKANPKAKDEILASFNQRVLDRNNGDLRAARFAWMAGTERSYEDNLKLMKRIEEDPEFAKNNPETKASYDAAKKYFDKLEKKEKQTAPIQQSPTINKELTPADESDNSISQLLNSRPQPSTTPAPVNAPLEDSDVAQMLRNNQMRQPQQQALEQPMPLTTTRMPGFNKGGEVDSDWKLSDYGGRKTEYNADNTLKTDKQKRTGTGGSPQQPSRNYDTPAIKKGLSLYEAAMKKQIEKEEAANPSQRGPKDYNAVDKDGYKKRYNMGGEVTDYQEGGDVDGPGTATSDSIPAMLSDGEFVIRASVVAHPTVEKFLHKLNKGNVSPQDLAKILSKRAKK